MVSEFITLFAHDTRVLPELMGKIPRESVEFGSQKEAIDTGVPTEKFMLPVFSVMAELKRSKSFSVSGRKLKSSSPWKIKCIVRKPIPPAVSQVSLFGEVGRPQQYRL